MSEGSVYALAAFQLQIFFLKCWIQIYCYAVSNSTIEDCFRNHVHFFFRYSVSYSSYFQNITVDLLSRLYAMFTFPIRWTALVNLSWRTDWLRAPVMKLPLIHPRSRMFKVKESSNSSTTLVNVLLYFLNIKQLSNPYFM